MLVEAVLLLISIVILLYHLSKWKFDYWKQRKIPYLKPVAVLGNYGPYILLRKYIGHVVQEICQKFPNEPYFGAFYGTEPTLIVQDPEILKIILTKDFYYFNSREISNYTHFEVATQNLLFTYGDRWKVLRQNLTPIFSTSKMRNMFYLIEKCSQVFEDMLDREFKTDIVTEVRPLMSRFTMDCIGSCVFGIDTETMTKKDSPFVNISNSIFLDTYYRGFKIITRAIWPALFYGLRMKIFSVEVEQFFHKFMTKVFAGRQYKPTNRKDFVDHILNWTNNKFIIGDSLQNIKGGAGDKKVSIEVDDEILESQSLLLFGAGYETSSTTLQYTLYELAKHPETQQRAIDEIDEYLRRHNNKLEYKCVTELPYTEACFDEALRLYPVAGVFTREVTEEYSLPCGAVLQKGTRVHIPLYHLHHNPDLFPDPEEFRPERFYGEEKRNIKPYTYMPFGEGPRICIGMRFAKMQMFAGMVTLLKKYRVELAEGTPRKLEFTATTIVTQPREQIQLKFVEREGWQQRQYEIPHK